MTLLATVLLGASCSKGKAAAPATSGGKRAVPITVAVAVRKPVSLELNTFGTVQAKASVAIRSQVGEMLTQVNIEKGQKIARGDLLFTIESKPFEIALQQAQATLARDRIQAANAKLEADRSRQLVEKNIAAQTDSDNAMATAAALAETVKADEAVIAGLELDVQHCRILSPISGRAGNVMVHAGNLVKANDVPLVVINQISPIEVFFAIPQRELERVRANMAEGELTVEATIPDDLEHPEKGRLTFIDNAVETASGTLQLAAVFPNVDERLWPGRYVRVRLFLAVQQGATVVPARAVQTGSDGQFVFVVKADQTVALRPVKVGRISHDEAVIDDGLQPDEQVVTDGHLQLTDGANIQVKGEDGKSIGGAKETKGAKHAAPAVATPAAAPGVAP